MPQILKSLCQKPKVIKDLFLHESEEQNEWGIYRVKLHIDGIWKEITIDDYLPFNITSGEWVFSKSDNLWVMLLEKAMAKVKGSYSEIEDIEYRDAVVLITGCCTKTLFLDDENLWDQLTQYSNTNCVMAAIVQQEENEKNKELC